MTRVKTMPGKYKALLLDLDGTLLKIEMQRFIPLYLQALAPFFAAYAGSETVINYVLEATTAMIENTDPKRTNEAIFYAEFCRRLEQPRAEVAPVIERFYREKYPELRRWGQPRRESRPVLEAARRAGLLIVLATNPVFPRTAIEQRVTWGGLDPSDFDFITTIENMHFCKPNPNYYREIAARIDCSPANCLMAGNDVREDLCAAETGMDTFLVDDHLIHQEGLPDNSHYRGSLENLAMFLDRLAGGVDRSNRQL